MGSSAMAVVSSAYACAALLCTTGCVSYGVAGGGGGYFGGGGVAGGYCGGGGAGGGSSWTGSLGSPTFQAGVRTGNGTATISW